MRVDKIVVRTSGGVGNQLFQLLAGYAYSKKYGARFCVIHDLSYLQEHSKQRTNLLDYPEEGASLINRLISKLRPLKIFNKLGGNRNHFKLFNVIYLDGYYQNLKFWQEYIDFFPIEIFPCVSPPKKEKIIHMRLGDFFEADEDRMKFIRKRFAMTDGVFEVMSNSENLVNRVIIERNEQKRIKLLSTAQLKPDEVLLKMCEYAHIDSNESTLAFWAALFGRRHLDIHNRNLELLYNLFVEKLK